MNIQFKALTRRSIPVIVDLLAIVLYGSLVPRLSARFQQKSLGNVIIVAGAYLLLCVAVFFIRKLEGERESAYIESGSCLAFLGITFAIFVSFMMADVAGVFDNLESFDIDPNNTAAYAGILGGFIAWLVLIFLYPGILMAKIQPSITRDSNWYFVVELLSLLVINLMIIVTMAHWDAYFADTVPYDLIGLGAKLLIFFATFAFFLLFYGPPRLLFLAKNAHPTAIVTFLLQLGYYVWQSLAHTAW